MAHWKNKIDISKEFKAYNDGEGSIKEVISILISELNKINNKDNILYRIIEQFKSLEIICEEEDVEEMFNNNLDYLYNWGDLNNRLWINII